MAKRSRTIPKASAARILNGAGAERVSDSAAGTFADILEEIAQEISEQAVKIAKHSGRKTVQGGDIKLAAKD
ncbi:NFYB/HAP3 family transcription factor subunit [Candidatus Woesearchaeota archaeon]|nr:NFYB/HAP3 family transcription factor subunit [Candidatus Woesearchaeota archaeon]